MASLLVAKVGPQISERGGVWPVTALTGRGPGGRPGPQKL